jgi:signal transduction histidine kinase
MYRDRDAAAAGAATDPAPAEPGGSQGGGAPEGAAQAATAAPTSALHASRAFLQSIIDAVPESIVVIDREYRVVLTNRSARVAAGGRDPDSACIKCHELSHRRSTPCEGREDPCPLREVIRTRAPVVVTHTHFDAAGTESIVEITASPILDELGEVIQVVEACRDVTERVGFIEFERLVSTISNRLVSVGAEAIDQEIRLALRMIGEYARVDRSYVFQFSRDGQRISCTHEWCAPGVPPGIQDVQDAPLGAFPWQVPRHLRGEVVQVPRVSDLPEEARAEKELLTRQGVRSLLCVPLAYGGGVLGFLGFDSVRGEKDWPPRAVVLLRLVGEIFAGALTRKRSEERILEISGELERSNLDLQHFASVVSHDLKAPLRAVSLFLELLQRRNEGRLDEESAGFVARSRDAARHMGRLIDDLLAYSRAGTRKAEYAAVDAGAALQRALDNLAPAIQESGAAVKRGEMPTVVADEGQLTQVFQNLVDNALKYRDPARPCEVRIAVRRGEGHWLFQVSDSGIGIDPKDAQRVFVIFERLHSAEDRPGTGVGLAICKRIVERHGGRIWVESQPAQGSTFSFTLPDRPAGGKEESAAF